MNFKYHIKKIFIFAVAISVILAFSACTPGSDSGNSVGSGDGIDISGSKFEVIVFSTGNTSAADAILMQTENHNRMIDTSTNKGFKEVRKYFTENEISVIDCLIVTHFDNDHIGGADTLFDIAKVRQVIIPLYNKESKQYGQMEKALKNHSLPPTVLTEDTTLTFDDVIFTLYPPERDFYGENEENDFSIITSVTHHRNKFLFMGDAENARTMEYLKNRDISHNFLKVPYHGRYKAAYSELFTRVKPDYAVVTNAVKEAADENILNLLISVGAKVYETSDGTVIIKSDGKELTVTQ